MAKDLLFEIGAEEIPAGFMPPIFLYIASDSMLSLIL